MTLSFTISNIAGGDLRQFRLINDHLSSNAVRYASNIGLGGPDFGGPAGERAAELWQQHLAELDERD